MTKSERLIQKVLAEFIRTGHTAHSCDLWPAKGHWRTSKYADVYRFEGQINVDGYMRTIVSWSTMTALLKTGIALVWNDGQWEINPSVNKPKTKDQNENRTQ